MDGEGGYWEILNHSANGIFVNSCSTNKVSITPPVQSSIDKVTQRRSQDRYLTAKDLIHALKLVDS